MNVNEIEDETPTLGAVPAQTYRVGQAVNVRLPGATGGNPPVTYALKGPLPATTPLTFGAATVASQTYPLNQANRILTFYLVTLPELPAGLTYIPPRPDEVEGDQVYLSGGQIVGTPTARTPQRQYTLMVVDAAGNEEDSLPFELATGAASSDPGPGPEDRQPTFGDATVEAQRYTVGTAVTLTFAV